MKRELISIPGIALAPGGLRCTWDIAEVLASKLGVSSPVPPLEKNVDLVADVKAMPGLSEYLQLGLRDRLRPYQREGALFLARRTWAMNCDPMRSGKSVQSLAASILVGAKHVLIVCPALAKYVWADEIHKWLGQEALILEGRAGTHAREYCGTCGARGFVMEGEQLSRCPDCVLRNGQANGYRIVRVRKLKEQTDIQIVNGAAQKTITYACPKHKDMATSDSSREGAHCELCKIDMKVAIDKARYVIVNYDLLVSQKSAGATGVVFTREDLQGWAPILAQHRFDLCIADESHTLRGWSSDPKKAGQTRRERFAQVVEHFDRVWALTGTPIYGFTRDLWGQLDAVSNGLFSDRKGLPFNFHARYPVHEDARVLCGDLRWRPIKELRVDDEIWGWSRDVGNRRIVRTHVKEVFDLGVQDMVEIEMDDGRKVTCTPDHRWAVVNAAGRIRWVEAQELMEQQYRPTLVDVGPAFDTPAETQSYRRGYLRGLMDGDGTIRDDHDAKGHRRRNWKRLAVKAVRKASRARALCVKSGLGNLFVEGLSSHNCDGHKDDYGWKANGRSALADTELKDRLEFFKMQRPRSVILKDMPPKVRQIIRLDEDEKTRRAVRAAASAGVNEGKLMRLLKQTSVSKRSAVVDNVLDEMAAGEKCVVFTLLRDSAQQLGKALEKGCRRRELKTRMREVDARVWTTHGDASPKARFELAKKFREHKGAGVFIATIDSVQVAVSLKGASSVHFADLHWQPSAMLQAEDRPYEVGVTGLSIIYYIVKGSVDEHVEAVVLPKVETLAQIVDEQGADEMKAAFGGPEETMDEIYARMSAHLKAEQASVPDEIGHDADWDEEF